jgi:hypothetical protein
MNGMENGRETNAGVYNEDLIFEGKEKQRLKKEKKMEKTLVVSNPFEIMDRLDDKQIVDSIKGAIIEAFVYSYREPSGKLIEGLSKTGVDESCKRLANKGEVIRELECDMEKEDDTYAYFKAKAGRYAISPDGKEVLLETKIGHKRQCKYIVGKGNVPDRQRPNSFWYEQGGQKSLRNCRRDLLSEEFMIALIKEWKEKGRVQEIKAEDITNGNDKPSKPAGDLTNIINFGKYKGYSLEEIYHKKGGVSYLDWLVKETKDEKLRDSINLFLDAKRDLVQETQMDLSAAETDKRNGPMPADNNSDADLGDMEEGE